MSQEKTYRISCPKCGHEQEVSLFDSVNVGEGPDLKQALMRNQINNIHCARCEFSFRIGACQPAS